MSLIFFYQILAQKCRFKKKTLMICNGTQFFFHLLYFVCTVTFFLFNKSMKSCKWDVLGSFPTSFFFLQRLQIIANKINLCERHTGVHTVLFLLMNECNTLFCNDWIKSCESFQWDAEQIFCYRLTICPLSHSDAAGNFLYWCCLTHAIGSVAATSVFFFFLSSACKGALCVRTQARFYSSFPRDAVM